MNPQVCKGDPEKATAYMYCTYGAKEAFGLWLGFGLSVEPISIILSISCNIFFAFTSCHILCLPPRPLNLVSSSEALCNQSHPDAVWPLSWSPPCVLAFGASASANTVLRNASFQLRSSQAASLTRWQKDKMTRLQDNNKTIWPLSRPHVS